MGAPVVVDKVVERMPPSKKDGLPIEHEAHIERVRCANDYISDPLAVLPGGRHNAAASSYERGTLLLPPVIHLKASQRYPTHEYAFSLLHDCLSAAEAARLREAVHATDGNRSHLHSQALWAHGLI